MSWKDTRTHFLLFFLSLDSPVFFTSFLYSPSFIFVFRVPLSGDKKLSVSESRSESNFLLPPDVRVQDGWTNRHVPKIVNSLRLRLEPWQRSYCRDHGPCDHTTEEGGSPLSSATKQETVRESHVILDVKRRRRTELEGNESAGF